MNRIEHRILAGIAATVIGFATIGIAEAADARQKCRTVPPSPAAKAALIARVVVTPSAEQKAAMVARIVVTPSAEQMAKFHPERRMNERENRAGISQQTAGRPALETGAL